MIVCVWDLDFLSAKTGRGLLCHHHRTTRGRGAHQKGIGRIHEVPDRMFLVSLSLRPGIERVDVPGNYRWGRADMKDGLAPFFDPLGQFIWPVLQFFVHKVNRCQHLPGSAATTRMPVPSRSCSRSAWLEWRHWHQGGGGALQPTHRILELGQVGRLDA